jgi:hypothetical protein
MTTELEAPPALPPYPPWLLLCERAGRLLRRGWRRITGRSLIDAKLAELRGELEEHREILACLLATEALVLKRVIERGAAPFASGGSATAHCSRAPIQGHPAVAPRTTALGTCRRRLLPRS